MSSCPYSRRDYLAAHAIMAIITCGWTKLDPTTTAGIEANVDLAYRYAEAMIVHQRKAPSTPRDG